MSTEFFLVCDGRNWWVENSVLLSISRGVNMLIHIAFAWKKTASYQLWDTRDEILTCLWFLSLKWSKGQPQQLVEFQEDTGKHSKYLLSFIATEYHLTDTNFVVG